MIRVVSCIYCLSAVLLKWGSRLQSPHTNGPNACEKTKNNALAATLTMFVSPSNSLAVWVPG